MLGIPEIKNNLGWWAVPFGLILAGIAPTESAQIYFESGSTGADGPLIFEQPESATTVVFDPATFDPPLDPEGDNIFHFTTIYIPTNLTLRMTDEKLGSLPVIWLSQGDVIIDGTLDLNGEGADYYNSGGYGGLFAQIAGAGGFRGGKRNQAGCGPGAGGVGIRIHQPYFTDAKGGGAGHANVGNGESGGRAYGNMFLMPLIGGSGGGGGESDPNDTRNTAAGGGGGGGAILIASSTSIVLKGGRIQVNGGAGELAGGTSIQYNYSGGGGSGGSIRMMAPEISGYGWLDALGGHYGAAYSIDGYAGSEGRIRLECYEHNRHFLLQMYCNPMCTWGTPIRVFPPETAPKVRVTSIDGVSVPERARGFYLVPDVEIVASTTSTVTIETNYVPVGTEVELTIQPEYESQITVITTPLQGTLERSTAEARVQFPPGFSRGYVFANWEP